MSINTVLYANEALVNSIFKYYRSSNPRAFVGKIDLPEIERSYSYKTSSAPTIDLSKRTDGRNFSASFKKVVVSIYPFKNKRRGKLIEDVKVDIDITGLFSLSNNSLKMSKLKSVGKSDGDSHVVSRQINKHVLPKLQAQFQSIPLPDFSRYFGVPTKLESLTVKDRQLYCQGKLGISKKTMIIPNYNPKLPNTPMIGVAISQSGVEDLVRPKVKIMKASVADDWLGPGKGAGWEANASAWLENPTIRVSKGVSSGQLTGGVHARGRLKTFWVWHDWIQFKLKLPSPPMGIKLAAVGKKAQLTVYLSGKILIDWAPLPAVFKQFANQILSALGSLRAKLESVVNTELKKVKVFPYTLPPKTTGVPSAKSFKFLGAKGNSIVAEIDIG